MRSSYKQKFIANFLLTIFVFGNFSTFAQKRTGTAAKPAQSSQTSANNQKKESKSECKGNFTGVINYNRTIKTSHPGQYGSAFNRTYIYQSTMAIRDDGSTQGSIYPDYNGIGGSFNFNGKGSAMMSETVDDLKVSEKDDYCKLTLKGAQDKRRVRCESHFTRQETAEGSGTVNAFLGFSGNKYKISVDNPKVSGQGTEISKSSCSGTCGPDKPLNSSTSDVVKNATENGSYTDEIPFDPANFNRLSGSFTRPDGDETVTITWNLSRCAPPLQVNSLAFEHHVFPDPTNWHGLDSMTGTTDGNLVKVKAQVFNNGGETAYATVKFSETTSGEALPNGAVSISVKPGEVRDVEYEWDTSGYSWDDGQKPKPNREIKAEIEGGDAVTQKIKILPKPVILAHGLWSNAGAWVEYPGYLREAHSFAWHGYPVGADPEHGKMNTGDHPGNAGATNTVYQNAQEEAKQIQFAREQNNAWHVDIVAHSMGGLISRQYINTFMPPVFDGKPAVTHLVMLGTPNMGSPCADTVNQLFEDFGKNDMQAMRELRPIIVRAFNARVTDRKGVRFSILIGVAMPRTCLDDTSWGDGVVPIGSAKYNNTDFRYVMHHHLDLTSKEDFLMFVMPRLAIGPKKAKSEQSSVALLENNSGGNLAMNDEEVYQKDDRYGFNQYFQKASYRRRDAERASEQSDQETDESQKNLTTKQKVDLEAKETREIEIPVTNANFAGVVLAAPVAVSATLLDANGTVVGQNKGGMDAMKDLFRTISVNKQITKGAWKLRIENLGNEATTAFVAGFAGSNSSDFTVTAGKPTASGEVPLTAKLMINNAPVTNAKITANIAGESNSIEFFDDGKHGDGAAGDGVYGAECGKLAKGDYYVEAKAEANNQTQMAVTNFTIGGAVTPAAVVTPAKAATPKRKGN